MIHYYYYYSVIAEKCNKTGPCSPNIRAFEELIVRWLTYFCLLLTLLCNILTHLIRRVVKRHLQADGKPKGSNKPVISRKQHRVGMFVLWR